MINEEIARLNKLLDLRDSELTCSRSDKSRWKSRAEWAEKRLRELQTAPVVDDIERCAAVCDRLALECEQFDTSGMGEDERGSFVISARIYRQAGHAIRALSRQPAQADAEPVAWPDEPTEEMLDALASALTGDDAGMLPSQKKYYTAAYKAMRAAAPAQPDALRSALEDGISVGNFDVRDAKTHSAEFNKGLMFAASLWEQINCASDMERHEGSPGAGAMATLLEFRDLIRSHTNAARGGSDGK